MQPGRNGLSLVVGALVLGGLGLGCGQRELAGGALDGPPACGDAFAPPTPQPSVPSAPGCYEKVNGGWIPVLCLCQLPIDNMTGSPANFVITLDMSASSPVPSFGGSLDVRVSFPDPGAQWDAIWATDARQGTDYQSTSDGSTTTVELGVSQLTLAPVPLSACGARVATASISGAYDSSWVGLKLNMTASIEGRGTGAATATAYCPAPVPL